MDLALGAEAPDDQFFDIYTKIESADHLFERKELTSAEKQYAELQDSLGKFQTAHPQWNPDVVEYRMNYLEERLRLLRVRGSFVEAPATNRFASAVETVEVQRLKLAVQSLQSEKLLLTAKLQEALDLGAESPTNKLQNLMLQKERDLLRALLSQKRIPMPEADWANNQRTSTPRKRVAEANRPDLVHKIDSLMRELAEAEAQRDELELITLKNLRTERDELRRKLDGALKQIKTIDTTNNMIQNAGARQDIFFTPTGHQAPPSDTSLPPSEPVFLAEPAGADAPQIAGSERVGGVARKTIKELPAGARALAAEGEREFAARRFEEAERTFEEVVKQDNANPYVFVHLAACQLELNKLDAAGTNVDRALKLDAEDAAALTLQGILFFRQKKLDQAFAALRKSSELNPRNASTQNYLGIVLSEKGQRKEAESALRKALELQPDYAVAHNNLAVVYATQQPAFLELARFHYQKALALGESRNPDVEKILHASRE